VKKQKPVRRALYLQKDFRITDEDGKVVSCEDARDMVGSGTVNYSNVAFQRLVASGFDLEAVKGYYANQSNAKART
jgi:hypothetical protein